MRYRRPKPVLLSIGLVLIGVFMYCWFAGHRDGITSASFIGILQAIDGSVALLDEQEDGADLRIVGTLRYEGSIQQIGPGFALIEVHSHRIRINSGYRPAVDRPEDEWRAEVARWADRADMEHLFARQPRLQGWGPSGSAIARGESYWRIMWPGVAASAGASLAVMGAVLAGFGMVRRARCMLRATRVDRGLCWRCAYDLSGHRGGPCPECGAHPGPPAP